MGHEWKVPGVYYAADGAEPERVHQYADGDYLLKDIAALFSLGELKPDGALILRQSELRALKVRADAESFDHEEGFIEMCLDICRFALEKDQESLRFVSMD
jgi:hypothetical protein